MRSRAISDLSSKPESRLPEWLKIKLPQGAGFAETGRLLADLRLNTVCQSARCPNIFECFGRQVATFLILGPVCSRSCSFCNVSRGVPLPLDPDEAARVSQAAARLGLKHAVVTSVTRDVLPDGGAEHFASVITRLKTDHPGLSVEVLIPDFQGSRDALLCVAAASPDVINHNLETVPRLYPLVRPQADYRRSLELLARVKELGLPAKSGLMAGLGESLDELEAVLGDLADLGCDMVTIGQYLRPSKAHPEVSRYLTPREFEDLAERGRKLGIKGMSCGPLVRSSYRAEQGLRALKSPDDSE